MHAVFCLVVAARPSHAVYQDYGWPLDRVPKISPGLVKIVLDTAREIAEEQGKMPEKVS